MRTRLERRGARQAAWVALLLLTGGCGGGGGGGSDSGTSPVSFRKARGFDGPVFTISGTGDGSGKIYAGGAFRVYDASSAGGAARLNPDGSMDASFHLGIGFNGGVNAIAPAGDGSGAVYFGGTFTQYQGFACSRIVRLTADGSIDAGFAVGTGFDDFVTSVVPAGDGSGDVYVGGGFSTYKGGSSTFLARLNSNGSIDAGFAVGSGFNNWVQAIAPAGDGSGDIYVGGYFTSYQGTASNRIIRLNSNGSIDAGFGVAAGFDNAVLALTPAGDGSGDLYAGGYFTSYQGTARNYFARLNSNGTIDSGFNLGTGFNSWVYAIAIAADGSGDLFIGGAFFTYKGIACNRIIRLLSGGAIEISFSVGSGFENPVTALAPAGNGSGDLYVGGQFDRYQEAGCNHIVRLNSDASIDPGFVLGAGFDHDVLTVVGAGDGSGDIYVGGHFSAYQGAASNRILRLNADGTADSAFAVGTGFNGAVHAIAPAGDGSGDIYVGGDFTTYQGVGCIRIARLNSDGSIDPAFAAGTGFNDRVTAIVPVGNGSGDIHAGGYFTTYQGSGFNRLVRLNANGSVYSLFFVGTGFNDEVLAIASAGDGSGDLYVGGGFSSYNGTASNYIIRLNSDGTVDGGFNVGTGFDSGVLAIAPAGDGSGDVYAGGYFSTYKGTGRNRIIRLNSDGSIDPGFAIGLGFSDGVFAITPAADGSGRVYLVGDFYSFDNYPANGIARLNSDGTLDFSLAALTGFNNDVYAIASAADGSGEVIVGGAFRIYQTFIVDRIVRLSAAGNVE